MAKPALSEEMPRSFAEFTLSEVPKSFAQDDKRRDARATGRGLDEFKTSRYLC
jgi:hypothetical protein